MSDKNTSMDKSEAFDEWFSGAEFSASVSMMDTSPLSRLRHALRMGAELGFEETPEYGYFEGVMMAKELLLHSSVTFLEDGSEAFSFLEKRYSELNPFGLLMSIEHVDFTNVNPSKSLSLLNDINSHLETFTPPMPATVEPQIKRLMSYNTGLVQTFHANAEFLA